MRERKRLNREKIVRAATNLMRVCNQAHAREQLDRLWGKGTVKQHTAELCETLGIQEHGHANDKAGKLCTTFEFVAPSARSDSDVLFTAHFPSGSSKRTWTTTAWKHGDYSCNCTGWRNYRTCEHTKLVAADPKHYEKQAGQVSATTGSVETTVRVLHSKMADMEAAVKSGNPVEIAKLQAEIDYQRSMFEQAGEGLSERFAKVQANIQRHVFGPSEAELNAAAAEAARNREGTRLAAPRVAQSQSSPKTTVIADPDDPFAS